MLLSAAKKGVTSLSRTVRTGGAGLFSTYNRTTFLCSQTGEMKTDISISNSEVNVKQKIEDELKVVQSYSPDEFEKRGFAWGEKYSGYAGAVRRAFGR